ncbi:MAG: PilZ domain-containing protein [Spirochaetales bacterium]|nr:PilZ domain-containing protein [Spirochaetales bacterium]
MNEKRQFPRVVLSSIVDYSSTISARARDVSETGIGILSRRDFETGTPLFLVISLPELGLFKTIGQVVWTKEIKEDLYTNGLKFLSLKKDDRDKIKTYVQKILNSLNERRKTSRTVLDILINFEMKGRSYAKNLNLDGMCMVTSRALEQGKIILLGITLPDSSIINVYGRVVWCKNNRPNIFENGIEFLDIKKEDLELLKSFVHKKTAQEV